MNVKVSGQYDNSLQFDHIKNDVKTKPSKGVPILLCINVMITVGLILLSKALSLFERIDALIMHRRDVFDQVFNPQLNPTADLSRLPRVTLSQLILAYNSIFKPNKNWHNLEEYNRSEDFARHAKTARIYYNQQQLPEELDALRITFQREPTNIAMEANQYSERLLETLFGYKKGVYNDPDAKKTDRSSFKDLPNTVTVYSETYLWPVPGKIEKRK